MLFEPNWVVQVQLFLFPPVFIELGDFNTIVESFLMGWLNRKCLGRFCRLVSVRTSWLGLPLWIHAADKAAAVTLGLFSHLVASEMK